MENYKLSLKDLLFWVLENFRVFLENKAARIKSWRENKAGKGKSSPAKQERSNKKPSKKSKDAAK